jgi:hypothetical protein
MFLSGYFAPAVLDSTRRFCLGHCGVTTVACRSSAVSYDHFHTFRNSITQLINGDKRVKQSHYRPWQALRVQEFEAPRFQDNRQMKVARLSALSTGRLYPQEIFLVLICVEGTRWRSGWGTALQTGRSRFRFPMVSLEFFIDIILPVAVCPWGRLIL